MTGTTLRTWQVTVVEPPAAVITEGLTACLRRAGVYTLSHAKVARREQALDAVRRIGFLSRASLPY